MAKGICHGGEECHNHQDTDTYHRQWDQGFCILCSVWHMLFGIHLILGPVWRGISGALFKAIYQAFTSQSVKAALCLAR
eukprot:6327613-Ditylum_brightwellii.AAC.2